MSSKLGVQSLSLLAAADLSNNRWRCMTVNSSGQAALANATALTAGILQNKPGAGQPATVCYAGVSKAVAGAAVTAGARVRSDANGKVVPATVAGNAVIGIALESAGADNDVISVLLTPMPFAALA